jgi:hypothetical protein
MFGGDLASHPTFKKILSLGFEFETHDIVKFSLHENGTSLVNTDTILRKLNEQIEEGYIRKKGENYLEIKVALTDKSKDESDKDKPKKDEANDDELLDEYNAAFEDDEEKELLDEYQDAFEEKELLDEYKAAFEEEEELNSLDVVDEYFNESRRGDNTNNIKFQVTNDIGDVDFAKMLEKRCEQLTIPKNEMYLFKTNAGKTYDLKFVKELPLCQTFSGVEYVVTYYNPKRENSNVIVDTFIDACSRIIDHMANTKKIGGSLMIAANNEKTEYKTVGLIKNHRHIYHKTGTTLYYMDTYDDEEEGNEWATKRKSLGETMFTIQMTFRCEAADAVEIMMEILKRDRSYERGRTFIKDQKYEYNDFRLVEEATDKLLVRFDLANETNLVDNNKISRSIRAYVFMILYKIHCYVIGHSEILDEKSETYLKDYLTFASRHTNKDLYERIKQLLHKTYNITNKKTIMKLFYQPDILKPLYEVEEISEKDYDEEGNFLYGDPLNDELNEEDEKYGNPMYSLASYFKQIEEDDEDWFVSAKYDVYSTTFDLTNDKIMLENRFFAQEILLYLRNQVDRKISKAGHNGVSLNDMHRIVVSLYGDKISHMMNLKLDPKTNRLIKKSGNDTTRRASVVEILGQNKTKRGQRHLSRMQTAKANQSGGKKNRRTLKRSRR